MSVKIKLPEESIALVEIGPCVVRALTVEGMDEFTGGWDEDGAQAAISKMISRSLYYKGKLAFDDPAEPMGLTFNSFAAIQEIVLRINAMDKDASQDAEKNFVSAQTVDSNSASPVN